MNKQILSADCHFNIINLKVDPNAGDKWFIHGPKPHKEIQLQSMEHSCQSSLIGNT